MSRVTQPPLLARSVAAHDADQLRPAFCVLVAPLSVAGAIVAIDHVDPRRPVDWVLAALVIAWAFGGALVGVRRRAERVGPIMLAAAAIGTIALIAHAYGHPRLAGTCLGLLTGLALHLLVSLPDGRVRGIGRRVIVAVGYALGAIAGVLTVGGDRGMRAWPLVVMWVAAVAIGLPCSNVRYRDAGPIDRRRMQWVGWAIAVCAELGLALVALQLIADWPPHAAVVALAGTVLIPISLVAGTHVRMISRVGRLLTHTVALAGLTVLVILAYVAVVVALGRSVRGSERSLLLLSMAAAALACLAYPPVRARLTNATNQLVYGDQVAPDEALRTWGSRLTRAIPLDELLLQLTESLRKSMSLQAVEIYTGADGHYELTAGVPHRGVSPAPLMIGERERAIVARAGVSGGTWLDVWLPSLAPGTSGSTRVAPIAYGGKLLGLIVLTRRPDGDELGDDDDRVATELARQVGLALHNVQLDSALQASLADLQRANADLQESRLRIVSAGDAERRKLERNLHDGAQQQLVAMAVKLRLAEDLIDDDPVEAVKVIEELRNNLKEAINELRALAHGIFPPLLMSGGLREALRAAATRAALPTTVDTRGVGRYSAEIESTVYFCCVEAMQNAGKHAGDAELVVSVCDADGRLTFEVSDDGVGFELGPSSMDGHGFVNMTDRLGTVNGRLQVVSAPGSGTTIRGEIILS
jgi:signal transduction histidine kinase